MTEALEHKTSNLKKFFLLALSLYLILYCFPFPLTYIPNSIETLEWMEQPVDRFTQWFGKSVMGISDLKSGENYKYGDSIFEYVQLVSLPVLSLLLSAVIFVFSFRRNNYKNFYKWSIVYLRYNIGTNLFVMGCAILLNTSNYDSLDLHALEKPMGDYYGAELFWATIGFSKGYVIFCGISHVIIGSLLFFRKTTALGGFLAIVFYTNILAYNFAYGFTSKLYLMHILLFLFIILGPNIKALFRLFVRGKTTVLNSYEIHIASKEMRVMRTIAKYSFLALLLVHELTRLANNKKETFPLRGSYKSIEFIKNGDTLKFGEIGYNWDKLIIDKGYAKIVTNMGMGSRSAQVKISVDTAEHKFDLFTYGDTTKKSTFEYVEEVKSYPTFLRISGIYVRDTIQARFRKKHYEEYTLIYYMPPWINR